MSRQASERPTETPEVVALQNYINMCREDKIFKLKSDIKEQALRIMFLIFNATLDGMCAVELSMIFEHWY